MSFLPCAQYAAVRAPFARVAGCRLRYGTCPMAGSWSTFYAGGNQQYWLELEPSAVTWLAQELGR